MKMVRNWRWSYLWRLANSEYFKLALILGLAFYTAYIPHLSYPYPVHIDEWLHMTNARALMAAGSTTFVEPFLRQETLTFSTNLEAGFQLLLGVFQSISGLSWLTIYRFLPAVIFMFTVLSVYIMARREGFGWEAAFFTCLIPTTVGVLGPAFLVPLSIGLMFILPLPLFLVFNFRTVWSYIALFIFTSFLLAIHAVSAVGLVVILAPYVLWHLKSDFKHALIIILAVGIPFVAPFPWILGLLGPTAKSLLTPHPLETYVEFPRVARDYGYLPVILCLLGTFVLAFKGGKKNYSLVLGLLALLLVLVTYFTFHYGIPILYGRGLMYMMLAMSIVAGAGLMAVKQFKLPSALSDRLPGAVRHAGSLLCLAVVIVVLVLVIPARLNTPYYHMIDGEDYQAFVWIRDNIQTDDKALLDPWKSTSFTAITGKSVYARIHSFPKPEDVRAMDFIKAGCPDTAFLKDNGITLVYTKSAIDNPDLVEVRQYVYLLK